MDEGITYKPRIADKLLQDQLEAAGVVLIDGSKWCGKTTTAEHIAKSVLYMDDPKKKNDYMLLAESNPELLFEGEEPRLLDEWQVAPQLWDTARYLADRKKGTGHFIFTGSAAPADDSKINHTGTGRFGWVTMRPMSLWESQESNGSISMFNLFSGQMKAAIAPNTPLEEIAYMLCRGGWPGSLELKRPAALK